jgi:hypothetical protein
MRTKGVNHRWLVQSPIQGPIGPHQFRWNESEIPAPVEGQMLVRNLWLDIAPTQLLPLRVAPEAGGLPPGTPVPGYAAVQVLESKHPRYSPGEILYASSAWEEYSVIDGTGYWDAVKVPSGVSPDLAVGTLGITGLVAYFGVTEVARPRPGELFLISAAAGGVGSVAAQIARLRGLKVIGIAGGQAKCDWLLREAHIDAAIDHRSEDPAARLNDLCPDGIDIYFDNVGGPILDLALERLRPHGRIVLCGMTGRYADPNPAWGPTNYSQLIMVNGRMEGLLGRDYFDRFPEAMAALLNWVREGQIKVKEDVVVGLDGAPRALARLFSGENVGKQLVKIAEPAPIE